MKAKSGYFKLHLQLKPLAYCYKKYIESIESNLAAPEGSAEYTFVEVCRKGVLRQWERALLEIETLHASLEEELRQCKIELEEEDAASLNKKEKSIFKDFRAILSEYYTLFEKQAYFFPTIKNSLEFYVITEPLQVWAIINNEKSRAAAAAAAKEIKDHFLNHYNDNPEQQEDWTDIKLKDKFRAYRKRYNKREHRDDKTYYAWINNAKK